MAKPLIQAVICILSFENKQVFSNSTSVMYLKDISHGFELLPLQISKLRMILFSYYKVMVKHSPQTSHMHLLIRHRITNTFLGTI